MAAKRVPDKWKQLIVSNIFGGYPTNVENIWDDFMKAAELNPFKKYFWNEIQSGAGKCAVESKSRNFADIIVEEPEPEEENIGGENHNKGRDLLLSTENFECITCSDNCKRETEIIESDDNEKNFKHANKRNLLSTGYKGIKKKIKLNGLNNQVSSGSINIQMGEKNILKFDGVNSEKQWVKPMKLIMDIIRKDLSYWNFFLTLYNYYRKKKIDAFQKLSILWSDITYNGKIKHHEEVTNIFVSFININSLWTYEFYHIFEKSIKITTDELVEFFLGKDMHINDLALEEISSMLSIFIKTARNLNSKELSLLLFAYYLQDEIKEIGPSDTYVAFLERIKLSDVSVVNFFEDQEIIFHALGYVSNDFLSISNLRHVCNQFTNIIQNLL